MMDLSSIIDRAAIAQRLTEVMTAEEIVKFIVSRWIPKNKKLEIAETFTQSSINDVKGYSIDVRLVEIGEQ